MQTRYFVTDGPLATALLESSEAYFREGLAASSGVRIDRHGGTDFVAGSRYLEHGTTVGAEVNSSKLQVTYLGVVLAEYDDWTDFHTVAASDYPLRS